MTKPQAGNVYIRKEPLRPAALPNRPSACSRANLVIRGNILRSAEPSPYAEKVLRSPETSS